MRALVTSVTLTAWLFALGACGGKSKGSDSPLMNSDEKNPAATQIDPTLCETEGKRVMKFDLNSDDRPDLWKLYASVDEGGTKVEVQTCKQVDFNHDGRVDYAVGYSRKGTPLSEQFDFDFDGKFDAFFQYNEKSGNVFEVQRETGFDGKYDIQEVYNKEGKLSTVRHDRNADGKPDLWEQYNEAGQLVAVLYDEDFDNRVDRREAVEPPKTPKPPPPPAEGEDDAEESEEEGDDADSAAGAGDKEGAENSEPSESAQPAPKQGTKPATKKTGK